SDTIDDLRIVEITPLPKPADIIAAIHRNVAVTDTVTSKRDAIHKILQGEDERLIVVIGPCSIQDPVAAREDAERLA
ncbi:3-deoxy-7-phosphoheptulonate synthase, partial [Rhizobium ruizarguesonis]